MNQTRISLRLAFKLVIAISLLPSCIVYGQSNSDSGPSLTKEQRTVIIDAILSGNLDEISTLAQTEPLLAPAIAALYSKHTGSRGRDAGEIAGAICSSIDADISEASEVTAAVARSTASSLNETAEIMHGVAKALSRTLSQSESFATYSGTVANLLGLKGGDAGDFAVAVIEQASKIYVK